jgi:hypothetical protein
MLSAGAVVGGGMVGAAPDHAPPLAGPELAAPSAAGQMAAAPAGSTSPTGLGLLPPSAITHLRRKQLEAAESKLEDANAALSDATCELGRLRGELADARAKTVAAAEEREELRSRWLSEVTATLDAVSISLPHSRQLCISGSSLPGVGGGR